MLPLLWRATGCPTVRLRRILPLRVLPSLLRHPALLWISLLRHPALLWPLLWISLLWHSTLLWPLLWISLLRIPSLLRPGLGGLTLLLRSLVQLLLVLQSLLRVVLHVIAQGVGSGGVLYGVARRIRHHLGQLLSELVLHALLPEIDPYLVDLGLDEEYRHEPDAYGKDHIHDRVDLVLLGDVRRGLNTLDVFI